MEDVGNYAVREVFTPTKPARIAFVHRAGINDRLVNALRTPGKQIVVYGHSGTGKTTLLINKLHETYEWHITTRCMKGLTFDQLILDAFDQLGPFYVSDTTLVSKRSGGLELGSTYKVLSAKISASLSTEQAEKQTRILPPQLTPQALGKFLGAARACWVLEDFHKIDSSEKQRLAQLMKVFMDMADEYQDLKIVAIGAVDTARQVVEYDDEMKNRVAEISVPLMTADEISEIIRKGGRALNVVFSDAIAEVVSKHSNGLASVCHHLCLNMCDAAGVEMTIAGQPLQLTSEDCEAAVRTYVDEASDSIKSAFAKALKPRRNGENNAEIILEALSAMKEEGAARFDLLKRIQQSRAAYPDHRLKHNLNKMCEPSYGSILRFDPNSGLYSFADPIYRAYALARYRKPAPKTSALQGESIQAFEELLLEALRAKLDIKHPGALALTRTVKLVRTARDIASEP